MEIRDLLKKAFDAGQEYGSNRTDKNFNDFADKHKDQLMLGGVMKNAFAVIPDVERLDLGSNKIIAVFDRRHQAEEWAKSMWEKFYLIEEVQSGHFS